MIDNFESQQKNNFSVKSFIPSVGEIQY